MGTDPLAAAEERAGVTIRTLSDLSELNDARSVFDAVWPAADGSTQLPANLLKAMVHAGGYCSAAYRGDQPVGAAMGFVGRHRVADGWTYGFPEMAKDQRKKLLASNRISNPGCYPTGAIGILLGADAIPDMFRTVANVTGGIAATVIASPAKESIDERKD